jgi:hypothetical protein
MVLLSSSNLSYLTDSMTVILVNEIPSQTTPQNRFVFCSSFAIMKMLD